jgi:7-keto-8-aminopelargonate synthetase-like enzyme
VAPKACAGATAAIRHLKASQSERDRHQDRAARLKAVLNAAGLPLILNETHIVPVMVGEPTRAARRWWASLDQSSRNPAVAICVGRDAALGDRKLWEKQHNQSGRLPT